MTEHALLNAIRLALSPHGVRLFRNNVAKGWVGNLVRRTPDGSVILGNARPLHAGLCVGSSDLIGWTPLTITTDHVGRSLPLFTAIEAKTGRLKETDAQAAFRLAVLTAGGLGMVARDAETVAAELGNLLPRSSAWSR